MAPPRACHRPRLHVASGAVALENGTGTWAETSIWGPHAPQKKAAVGSARPGRGLPVGAPAQGLSPTRASQGHRFQDEMNPDARAQAPWSGWHLSRHGPAHRAVRGSGLPP